MPPNDRAIILCNMYHVLCICMCSVSTGTQKSSYTHNLGPFPTIARPRFVKHTIKMLYSL